MMKKEAKETFTRLIEDAGISLIKNAESIVGDYQLRTDIPLKLTIEINAHEAPRISFNTEFLSERIGYKRP